MKFGVAVGLARASILLALSLAFTVGFYATKTTHVSSASEPICLANGSPSFPWTRTINEFWDPSTALFITLGSGKYTFPQAKAIDVLWDLLVGRGGQVIAGILGYITLRRSLLLCMQEKAVPIPLAHAVYFHNLGIGMLGPLFGNLALPMRRPEHREKAVPAHRLLGWVYLCAYVLILPTIISAMTGYQTMAEMYFHPPGKSSDVLISGDSLFPNPPLAIRDGSRIGLEDNVAFSILTPGDPLSNIAPIDYNNTYSTLLGYYYAMQNAFNGTSWHLPIQSAGSGTDGYNAPYIVGPQDFNDSSSAPMWSYCTVTQHYNSCGDYALSAANSTQSLQGAPVGLSPDWTWSNITLFNRTHILQPPILDIYVTGSAQTWSASLVEDDEDGYFTNASIADSAVCQPSTTYQWGFSAVLLFVFCCLTVVFAAVLLTLEVEVWRYGHTVGHGDTYKDAVQIVAALKEEFGEDIVDGSGSLRERVQSYSGAVATRSNELPLARVRRKSKAMLVEHDLKYEAMS